MSHPQESPIAAQGNQANSIPLDSVLDNSIPDIAPGEAANEVLAMALLYVERGWRVLPLLPDSKIPLGGSNGVHDATTDKEKITAWFKENPTLNIGIAAGKESGLIVFDVDPRNGGVDSWREWQDQHGKVPDGAVQLTAGGGEHYLCEYTDALASCKLAPGIDVLSDGRYFVAYPSKISDRQYMWDGASDPRDGIAPFSLPDAWLSAYRSINANRSKSIAPEQIIKGNRNDGLTALAGAMRQYGMSEAEILAALKVANDTRCETPLPASEVKRIAASVSKYETDNDVAADAALGSHAAETLLQDKSTFKTFTFSDLAKMPRPKWLIKDMILEGTAGILSAESSHYKTFIAYDMGLSVALGLPCYGHDTKRGNVLYIAAEGFFTMSERARAWALYHGVELPQNFYISKEPVNLAEPAITNGLIKAVAEIQPAFIILDTLSQCAAGLNENDNGAMALFMAGMIRLADKTGASVMILHHNSKASGTFRGASSIKANADFHLSLDRPKNDDTNTVFCRCEKQRGKPFEDFTLQGEVVELPECDEYGDPITSLVFKAIDEPVPAKSQHPKKESGAKTREKLLELFDQAAQNAEKFGGGVKVGCWKELVENEEVCADRTFWRYKTAMINDGTIIETGTHKGSAIFQRGDK